MSFNIGGAKKSKPNVKDAQAFSKSNFGTIESNQGEKTVKSGAMIQGEIEKFQQTSLLKQGQQNITTESKGNPYFQGNNETKFHPNQPFNTSLNQSQKFSQPKNDDLMSSLIQLEEEQKLNTEENLEIPDFIDLKSGMFSRAQLEEVYNYVIQRKKQQWNASMISKLSKTQQELQDCKVAMDDLKTLKKDLSAHKISILDDNYKEFAEKIVRWCETLQNEKLNFNRIRKQEHQKKMYDDKIMELRENEVSRELVQIQDAMNRLKMPETDSTLEEQKIKYIQSQVDKKLSEIDIESAKLDKRREWIETKEKETLQNIKNELNQLKERENKLKAREYDIEVREKNLREAETEFEHKRLVQERKTKAGGFERHNIVGKIIGEEKEQIWKYPAIFLTCFFVSHIIQRLIQMV